MDLDALASALFLHFYRAIVLITITAMVLSFTIFRLNTVTYLHYEDNFDEVYVSNRSSQPLRLNNVIYPYDRPIKRTKYMKGSKRIALVTILSISSNEIYLTFINEIYSKVKDFNSLLSKKVFSCNNRLLVRQVKSILSVVPSVNQLSIKEFIVIESLIKEIAVNGILAKKYKKVETLENNLLRLQNGEELFSENQIEEKLSEIIFAKFNLKKDKITAFKKINIFKHFEDVKTFYRGLCNELNIHISIYIKRNTGIVEEEEQFDFSVAEPIDNFSISYFK